MDTRRLNAVVDFIWGIAGLMFVCAISIAMLACL